jgi:hypothetical protein
MPDKKPFKSNIKPMTEAQLQAAIRPVPFKHCPNCGRVKISSEKYCTECARLVELHMAPAVKQFTPSQDTQQPQSYPNHRHDGYSDRISNTKFDSTGERF